MRSFHLILVLSVLFLGCSGDDNHRRSLPEAINFKGEVLSCADFSVVQFLNSENHEIKLNISGSGREDLNLSIVQNAFALPNNKISCTISVHDKSIENRFCNDLLLEDQPKLLSLWNAISGTIKFSVSNIEEVGFDTYYTLNIELENIVFENDSHNEIRTIRSLKIKNANLGFFPG